jgi:octaprenyl-diphosphate synthase
MELSQIYRPIEKELKGVEKLLTSALDASKNKSIMKVNRFLLESGGKRLRPALVILSAKSAVKNITGQRLLINLAAAVELIHVASLIHDDIIDRTSKRHNKPTVNKKFGQDIAIAMGDYLYSKAFELVASCRNSDILSCISQAARLMCEGELVQVCERDNLELLKQRYLIIIKKKTAGLFAASCRAGAEFVNAGPLHRRILSAYGLNFGIAFQIIDDCLDLVGKEEVLGKTTGADLKVGELTLPVLYLLKGAGTKESRRIKRLLYLCKKDKSAFNELKKRLLDSSAILKAEEEARFYTARARGQLKRLDDSPLKRSLLNLADFVVSRKIS